MQTDQPQVSIIMPTYNRANTIVRAVESILAQQWKDFELLIIDDGSTDNTQSLIETVKDSRIKFIRMPENGGAAVARNKGIELAKGNFIAFQDSDDQWHQDKLQRQMNALFNTPENIGFVYCDMLHVINPDQPPIIRHAPILSDGEIIDAKQKEYSPYGIGQISIIVKATCFKTVGNFDITFPRFIDLEFFIRLSKRYQGVYIPESLATCYRQDGISANPRNGAIARTLLLKKYHNDIKDCSAFIAWQYYLIGSGFYHGGNKYQGLTYLAKAIIKNPFERAPVVFIIKRILGKN